MVVIMWTIALACLMFGIVAGSVTLLGNGLLAIITSQYAVAALVAFALVAGQAELVSVASQQERQSVVQRAAGILALVTFVAVEIVANTRGF